MAVGRHVNRNLVVLTRRQPLFVPSEIRRFPEEVVSSRPNRAKDDSLAVGRPYRPEAAPIERQPRERLAWNVVQPDVFGGTLDHDRELLAIRRKPRVPIRAWRDAD